MAITRADYGYYLLRTAFFVGPFVAGADKFLHWLTNWEMYLAPFVADIIPFSSQTFMYIVGVVEMLVGLMILAGFTRIGGYLAGAWLTGIVINLLIFGQFYDIALRDTGLALSAFALAQMSERRAIRRRHEPHLVDERRAA